MNQSEQISEIATALAKAQRDIKNPQKNKKVNVRTKTGGMYSFEYADLTAIIDAIKVPLSANGLSYIQTLSAGEDGRYRLHTRLLHNSGQWLESVTPLFVEDAASQSFGSALTFMKRYSLAALLGVAADSDDDANSADGNTAEVMDKGPRKPTKPAPSPLKEPPQASALTTPPHEIAVPLSPDHGERDWLAWGKTFIDTAKETKVEAVADAWLTANQNNLHDMLDEAPKAFARLKAALGGVYPKLLLEDGV